MNYSFNIPAILAIVFFTLPLVFKIWRQQVIRLSDLTKCTLAAMALPNLFICLFYLVTNPAKAMIMTETIQYLTIAVLIITYLTLKEIKQTFSKKNNDTS